MIVNKTTDTLTSCFIKTPYFSINIFISPPLYHYFFAFASFAAQAHSHSAALQALQIVRSY